MSSPFAGDVASTLGGSIPAEEVDEVLARAHVRPSGTVPVPRRLRLQRLRFAGVKAHRRAAQSEGAIQPTLLELPDAELTSRSPGGWVVDESMPERDDPGEPFEFSWPFDSGLYGIGSYENFRGKSSVLEVILWALRGRCGLQPDVRAWMRNVQLDFEVSDEQLSVIFDVEYGSPHGQVLSGGILLTTFDGHESFEAAMDEVMMPRLGLTAIPAWQSAPGGEGGQPVTHAWVTYAGALFITQRSLDHVLGDTSFSGLPGRLLQMFVGTPWASTMVEAQVSAKTVRAELDAVQRRARVDADAHATDRQTLENALREARRRLESMPDLTQSLRDLASAVDEVNARSASVARLQAFVTEAQVSRDAAASAVRDEEARRLALVEDALARRFFNAFEPTVCPRCSSPVTEERHAREREAHACSVCASDLDLGALSENLVLATDVPAPELEAARAGAELVADPHDDGEAEPAVDDLVALGQALDDGEQRLRRLVAQLAYEQHELSMATETVTVTRSADALLASRRAAEIEIARLEGALEQLGRAEGRTRDSNEQLLARRERILRAAENLARSRVQQNQAALLTRVSNEVLELGQQFGIEALERVNLRGNATLEVYKGGERTSYSRCTRGEQLRLKVATAVALLRVGFADGVGRHPGLLLVDSPGAEEAASENLDAMLSALKRVTTDVPYLQVVVATRSPESLQGLLDEDRRRIAPIGGYVW